MRKKLLVFFGMFALFFAVSANADQVGPTWEIFAGGYFTGYPAGAEAESFNLDLTLTFSFFSPDEVMPLWSGTASFAGILGTFSTSFANLRTSPADGGYLPFFDLYNDEIDIHVSDYVIIPLTQMYAPPYVGVPYLYSCDDYYPGGDPAICAAYGTDVGVGLFNGVGQVVQTVREVSPGSPVGVPEPSSLGMLSAFVLIAFLCRCCCGNATNRHGCAVTHNQTDEQQQT